MTRYKVITGTITYAIKGRDVLRRNGFNAELIRTVNGQEMLAVVTVYQQTAKKKLL